jgi:hypothetical protein
MLVDNKFIYISLPRCASTSFEITCGRLGLDVLHENPRGDTAYLKTNFDLESEQLADNLMHGHERLSKLEEKYGYNYDVISVNRNRHERFISLWKHCLDEVDRSGDTHSFNIMKKLNENDILYYSSNDVSVMDKEEMDEFVMDFINKFELSAKNIYLQKILILLVLPYSTYHQHNPKIKWFDFDKLYEMENWISEKLNIDFKLEKINSSKHFECNLKLTDNFIEKYNRIYDRFDIQKSVKTFL